MNDEKAGVEVKKMEVKAGELPEGMTAYQINIRFEDGFVEQNGERHPHSHIMGFPVIAESEGAATDRLKDMLEKCVEQIHMRG